MRGVVDGELWQSSSSSEYVPEFDGEGESEGEISMEAESDVDGEMWERMVTEQDVGLEQTTTEVSDAGLRSKRSLGGGAGCGGGGRGIRRTDVERRSANKDSGKGDEQRKSVVGKGRGGNEGGSEGGTVEDCDVLLRS